MDRHGRVLESTTPLNYTIEVNLAARAAELCPLFDLRTAQEGADVLRTVRARILAVSSRVAALLVPIWTRRDGNRGCDARQLANGSLIPGLMRIARCFWGEVLKNVFDAEMILDAAGFQ
ncbi:hypothetical protein AAE026_37560 [Bradyrhizobium sp. DN5]|uniref:hypothetical protein n=1 Tax=unclassified Bradyrhizobium TaxID=2631580 RepID=UPI00116006F4|nr:hypothetical protein [Bradyrhizobium sp. Rc2d]